MPLTDAEVAADLANAGLVFVERLDHEPARPPLPPYYGAVSALFESQDLWAPEFTMVSVDGRMLLHNTFWGNYTASTIVIRPDRLSVPAGA